MGPDSAASLLWVDDIVESHQGFTLIHAPFGRVLPALIGGSRALWGNVGWREADRRRALRFQADGNAAAKSFGGVYTCPPIGIIEASNDMTLIEDPLNDHIAKTLSLLLPEEPVLSIRSWTEGTVRDGRRCEWRTLEVVPPRARKRSSREPSSLLI